MERVEWISAVLAKHVPGGKVLNQSDLFLNVIGGLHTSDRGNDLAFAMAMASSALGREVAWPINGKRRGVAFIGEIGLTGDLRPAHAMWSRINAANKAGIAQIIVPGRWWMDNGKEKTTQNLEIEIIGLDSLRDTVAQCLVPEKSGIRAAKR
jgi:DNA repair protein RadA/Sms